jgi:hypothetical protein
MTLGVFHGRDMFGMVFPVALLARSRFSFDCTIYPGYTISSLETVDWVGGALHCMVEIL